jgi:hypothetical protein
MNSQDSNMAANAICHAAQQVNEAIQQVASCYGSPSEIYKPRLFVDGNEWCALLGEDIQSGICGFGKSPYLAMQAFNDAWHEPLPTKES